MVISPETRVGDLLDTLPEAEAALIAIAPKFKALKNPVLRRTVAKVATLAQAARVADMPVNELVRSLRTALGGVDVETDAATPETGVDGDPPAWVGDGAVHDLDADALLASGTVPVGTVGEALAGMTAGEALLVRSSFQVAPLIDAMRSKGHEVFTRKVDDDHWEAWVRKG